MGTGKTQFTKSLIAQLKREEENNVDGKKIGVLIFDYKGDYIKDDFIKATGAKRYDLYELPFNPLGLFMPKVPKPLLPVHTANELRDTIANAFNLGTVQTNKLKTLILDAYDLKGISKNVSSTWDREPPTMNTVLDIFFSNEDLKEDSLYSVLSEIRDYELFEPDAKKTKSLFELIDGVTIINLSSYPESIQNLVVAITLDTFYAQMQADGHSKQDGVYRQINKMVLVDEADNFLSKNFNSIKKILKEGREFGVGTILSTQFLKHFSTSENQYSQYILTWIIHKVSDISRTEAGNIFNIQGKAEQDALVNNIKNLQKHHSIINLGGDNEPKHIRDKAFWEL
jgi:DNA phosphorothioation-dependent restriction protein DptH